MEKKENIRTRRSKKKDGLVASRGVVRRCFLRVLHRRGLNVVFIVVPALRRLRVGLRTGAVLPLLATRMPRLAALERGVHDLYANAESPADMLRALAAHFPRLRTLALTGSKLFRAFALDASDLQACLRARCRTGRGCRSST